MQTNFILNSDIYIMGINQTGRHNSQQVQARRFLQI